VVEVVLPEAFHLQWLLGVEEGLRVSSLHRLDLLILVVEEVLHVSFPHQILNLGVVVPHLEPWLLLTLGEVVHPLPSPCRKMSFFSFTDRTCRNPKFSVWHCATLALYFFFDQSGYFLQKFPNFYR
jgi:hypothetical protein